MDRYVISKCKLCSTNKMKIKGWCNLKCELRNTMLKSYKNDKDISVSKYIEKNYSEKNWLTSI